MIKTISNISNFLVLSALIITSTFFSGLTPVDASQINLENDGSNSMEIIIEESNEKENNTKTNSIPDLGDDQAFPFIPGFGKNSGKD
tara:strand:+ start:767 stop:1027 length:261 start_codon:yes stop_codon:yes gene_type:complete